MVVYVGLAFLVAPSIMLQHSGKEVGLALANMDTKGKCIGYYHADENVMGLVNVLEFCRKTGVNRK